jgi:sulfate/thiosulfate transport system permease protein
MSQRSITTESPAVKCLLIGAACLVLILFLVLPLVAVFVEAFRQGAEVYLAALTEPAAAAAIKLTLITAAVSVPLNTLFGVSAAWLVTKFRFPGRTLLVSLIDLPFAISPVIAGLIWMLVFGAKGWLPPETLTQLLAPFASATQWLANLRGLDWLLSDLAHWLAHPKIVFSTPGIVIATVFITFPFVARELIPLMETQGTDEEEAAITLGAKGWQVFWRITLPNIKWGLLYGVLLCNARAMGEFGAVSVVSGHIRGRTNTLPLHVEVLYNEYHFAAAFACASILALLALVTLSLKGIIERFGHHPHSRSH